MSAPRNRPHLPIPSPTQADYRPPIGGGDSKTPAFVPVSRPQHGATLKAALVVAVTKANQRRAEIGFQVHGALPGTYIHFEGQPGEYLKVDSLEASKGVELVAVTSRETTEAEPQTIQMATVFISPGEEESFKTKLDTYSQTIAKTPGERRNEPLFDPIASLRAGDLESLWTDTADAWPQATDTIWWELWLRRHDGNELERLVEFADIQDITINSRRLQFSERIVVLVQATRRQLESVVDVLGDVAEIQRAKENARTFLDQSPKEQASWLSNLLERTTWPTADAPSVCILDTGINRGHPLFAGAISSNDCMTIDQDWGVHDHLGHGTEMAGIALYGDLTPILVGDMPIGLKHRLESVKILPPHGNNRPELYGAIVAEAISRTEINSDRRRCFSMAVTGDDRDRGLPTSQSVAIDALAAGRMFDLTTQELVYLDDEASVHRLFIISAGNILTAKVEIEHLVRCDSESIQDPGQAWNALTVGAYTTRISVDGSREGWEPLAKAGDLSPWSTTSVSFAKGWPLKPDVVFEGGNLIRSKEGEIRDDCYELWLLSAHHKPSEKALTVSNATSAAAAQAARMAAIICADSPSYWPETVRGLIVHSARWTNAMKAQFNETGTKREIANLVRRYGFGVPQLSSALRSANDALTLFAQASIQPFENGKMSQIHFYDLPWPKEELERLGEVTVRVRVTLSYFIEPNPGRLGFSTRRLYASHGLRFDLIRTHEEPEDFRKRRNQKSLAKDEKKTKVETDAWYIGEARDVGSIHSDTLECSAADLADRGMVAVYPVGGWWKHQRKRDRSEFGARYSLIISIETDAVDADIWSPVAVQVDIPNETLVEV